MRLAEKLDWKGLNSQREFLAYIRHVKHVTHQLIIRGPLTDPPPINFTWLSAEEFFILNVYHEA
jgi:hypothetical protein